MDDTRKDQDVSDDVITVVIYLASRLRQAPRPDHTEAGVILEMIRDAVKAERSRCLDAWIHSLPLESEEIVATDGDLPF